MFELKIPVARVVIIRSSNKIDKILFEGTEAHGEETYKDQLPTFGLPYYELDAPRGQGERVCEALGVPSELVEVVPG